MNARQPWLWPIQACLLWLLKPFRVFGFYWVVAKKFHLPPRESFLYAIAWTFYIRRETWGQAVIQLSKPSREWLYPPQI